MGDMRGIKACERSEDGGFKNIDFRCDFCSRISVTLVKFEDVYFWANPNRGHTINMPVYICKACCTEAIDAMDKELLKCEREEVPN